MFNPSDDFLIVILIYTYNSNIYFITADFSESITAHSEEQVSVGENTSMHRFGPLDLQALEKSLEKEINV